ETRRRTHRGNCGQAAMRAVKLGEGFNIDITQTVSIGNHHSSLADQPSQTQNAPAGHCLQTGVDQTYAPINTIRADHIAGTALQVYKIVVVMGKKTVELFLYHFAFISAAHQEVLVPITGLNLHDVPENRLPADFDHWLGPDQCLLSKPSSTPSGQNNY